MKKETVKSKSKMRKSPGGTSAKKMNVGSPGSLQDQSAKHDIELMQAKIQSMACQALVSRVEYCLENMEMRQAISKIQEFAHYESKIEAVEYMVQIQQRKLLFDSLIQWVKVVYAAELVDK